MADDIDIEEHDVLDNPRIKNIFPDITCIKTELINFDDEDINDFVEESYETYQQDLIDREILECSVILEDCGDSLKNNPCFCSDCEILFPTENALDSHKMTVHSLLAAVGRNNAIKSTTKSSVFVTDSNMERSNLFNLCNKVVPDEKSVLKQLLTREFSCNVCDKEFESEISLEQHLRTHPTDLLHCCPICSCCFKVTTKILLHMVHQHQVDVKKVPQLVETTYKCRFCPKILNNIRSYNNHIQYLHPELYKKIDQDKTHTDEFKSQSCDLTFRLKHCISSKAARLKMETDLNMELSNLHTYCDQVFPDEKPRREFTCNACDLEFVDEISLQQHSRTHPSVLMYCCPICSCCFKFTNKIKFHVVDQHQVDVKNVLQHVITTFKCRSCPKILKDNMAYNAHIQNVHPELYYKKIHKFECQPCNLTFPSAYLEKIHRVSQQAIEAETSLKSVDLDKQIKMEPPSPTIIHQVSQHAIIKTCSKSVDQDKQIKIEPLLPTITHRIPQPVLKTYSRSVNLHKQIKIEPLSPKINQTDLKQEL